MAGAGFGIDATRCRPALDPADCRRGPNIEKPRRLPCALTRLHDRQCPDPKVPGVSPCHRYPRCCLRRHTNLICESKGIPCDSSDSHQAESALGVMFVGATLPTALTTEAGNRTCGAKAWRRPSLGDVCRAVSEFESGICGYR